MITNQKVSIKEIKTKKLKKGGEANEKQENHTAPITDEGAMALVAAVLRAGYHEYVAALKTIMLLKSKKHLTDLEKKELNIAYQSKYNEEAFYLSPRYMIYTLQKGMPGYEVIRKIQKDVGYTDFMKRLGKGGN